MIRSRIMLLLFSIMLSIGVVYALRSTEDSKSDGKEPPTASLPSEESADPRGLDHPQAKTPGDVEGSPASSGLNANASVINESAAREAEEEPKSEWNPPIQQSVEDAKNFDENYSKALSHKNFKYAAQLIMRKKCADLDAGPENDDCLPFLREKLREEEQLFQSDDLAYFYVAVESDASLKRSALSKIERINPRFFKEREPCFQWRMSTEVEARAGFAGECIKVLVKLDAVGEAETSFWEEYTNLKAVNPERAERFRSELSPLLPELGTPGRGAKPPGAG